MTNRLLASATAALVAVSIGLVGCTTLANAGGDKTKTDEQLALAVETAYQVAASGMKVAVETHAVTGEARIAQLRKLNHDAFHAVCLTRVAYNFVNKRDLTTDLAGPCLTVVTPGEMMTATDLSAAAALAIGLVGQLGSASSGK